jgi:hypothetical protein
MFQLRSYYHRANLVLPAMPNMGQLRFVTALLATFLLISTVKCNVGQAQNHPEPTISENELIRWWDEAKLDSLLLLYRPFAAANPENPVTIFLKAALESDGNIAAQGYLALVQQGGNADVIPRAMKRLSNYYQTTGNLTEAIRWERRLEVEYPDFLTPPTKVSVSDISADYYTLQLGAFQNLENAHKLLEKAQITGLQSRINEQRQRGKTIYLVWAGKFTTSKEADETGKHLVLDHHLEYKVIKHQPEND